MSITLAGTDRGDVRNHVPGIVSLLEAPIPPSYSCRNAAMGSIAMARRAGM